MTDNLLDGPTEPQIDPEKNYLEELVGEGKKFKTPEELARGKFLADKFIEHKNQEYDKLRADYIEARAKIDSQQTLEELVDRLSKNPSSSDPTNNANDAMNQPKYDPKEVENLFETKFREREVLSAQIRNLNLVKEKLIERFGSNYQAHVKEQIDDLGLSDTEFTALAKANPKLVIKTLGLDQQRQGENFQSPPHSTVRSDTFLPKGAPKRDWNYYEKMRQTNPKSYTNPKTQVQMHQDAIAFGDSFYA